MLLLRILLLLFAGLNIQAKYIAKRSIGNDEGTWEFNALVRLKAIDNSILPNYNPNLEAYGPKNRASHYGVKVTMDLDATTARIDRDQYLAGQTISYTDFWKGLSLRVFNNYDSHNINHRAGLIGAFTQL